MLRPFIVSTTDLKLVVDIATDAVIEAPAGILSVVSEAASAEAQAMMRSGVLLNCSHAKQSRSTDASYFNTFMIGCLTVNWDMDSSISVYGTLKPRSLMVIVPCSTVCWPCGMVLVSVKARLARLIIGTVSQVKVWPARVTFDHASLMSQNWTNLDVAFTPVRRSLLRLRL